MSIGNEATKPKPGTSTHLTHPKYRPDIDGIRAIAVLSVLGFHAFPNWVKGGFIGVDIFFVISGFLISSILMGNLEGGTFSIAEFYVRRVKRIFPALVIVLTVTWTIGWYILLTDEYKQLAKHLAGGAGFVSNLTLWNESGYFDSSALEKPLLHLWSLGIEEQFYIFWPLLLWAVWKRKHNFLAITFLVAIASFAINIFTIKDHPVAAFYSPLARFWELMIGGILAYSTLHQRRFHASPSSWQAPLALLLIASGLFLLTENSLFPGWWALLPTIGTALLIASGPTTWINRKLIGSRPMVWVGLISYPLYLWHWPILTYLRILEGNTPPASKRVAALAICFLLSWATYKLVETPIRTKKGNAPVWALSGAALIIFVGTLLSWASDTQPRNTGRGLEMLLRATEDWSFPSQGFKPIAEGSQTTFVLAGSNEKALFLGDSHIQQYAPRISKVLGDSQQPHKTAIVFTEGGCPPIPGVMEDHHPGCKNWIQRAQDLIAEQDVDTIVIGACWYCYFIDMTQERDEDAEEGEVGSYEYYYHNDDQKLFFRTGKATGPSLESLEHFLAKLKNQGKTVYLLLDNPNGGEYNPKHFFSGDRISGLRYEGTSEPHHLTDSQKLIREQMLTVANRANVIAIDPIASLCNHDICDTMLANGDPIYKDSNHLRKSYVENHVKYLDTTLQ